MNWYKKALKKDYPDLTKEQLEKYEFEHPQSGSITPKRAFEKRQEGEWESLYDLSQYPDQWNFLNALGKGWEGHWEGVGASLYLINKIKSNSPINIYRASNTGGILPGAYVSESKLYAINHGETILDGRYKLYQLSVYPDELMSLGDPHEFLYIPRSLDVAHERLT